ncbi:3-hydroxyacyl-CoA dehydrogenase family protein [Actinobacteria bacterium YIM 96077]|uniref:3-hydroxybutyryl-CoA dehydrogenase n=1 Tax=Phytoactinopolyspora halophila TaxID=1981511 RepID=A0A329QT48_9ACTN|nr:3-hydroxyacyl-CoA dehydrogenase family protein [Phytoactinopolyspora halophila]AYY14922.1 3-hydroxyacyl-CoA dehydrogenase family protein [Actinobacteria bacterium YIM 96077]RAW15485.1 3-hydroxybutyryl-CoA dehydrogenase [Phytoactinopolyspora halophila]
MSDETGAAETSAPATAAVIGGGTMGAGIAHVLAAARTDVVVVESEATQVDAARNRIVTSLGRAVERGKLDQDPHEVLARIRFASDVHEIDRATDVVIEAVPEKPDLKVAVLAAAEQATDSSTVLASNTSSLSITELGAALDDPSRFLGMHFFNPVPASKLVEIVVAEPTAAWARDQAVSWVRALDKTDVVVRDSPGFATSRLGVTLGLEAIRMLEDGVADAEAIDNAMELGYRHPMGPLRLSDLVGLDVRLAVAEYLQSTLGERFAPPQLLRDKVGRGELGRKSGQGFYTWS